MGRKKRTPVEPIADALRAEIRRRELTAYRLAKMTGSSVDAIQGFISGTKGLTLKTIERLAAALALVLVPRDQVKGE
jgi:plasmid maintenance system antidote protein VapI